MKKICPLCFANPNAEMPYQRCEEDGTCAWWSEDTQKCAIAVIAESLRKTAKSK